MIVIQKMKMNSTLTSEQWVNLYKGNVEGFFKYLITSGDSFFSEQYGLCYGYYVDHSYSKIVSPTYERIINMVDDNPSIGTTQFELIASVIRNKFNNKWSRVYDLLIEQQYNALNMKDESEHRSGNNSNKKTYNSQFIDDGNTGTNLVTQRNNKNESSLYGFNSVNPVNTDEDTLDSKEIITGNSTDNTIHNTRVRSGEDTVAAVIDETTTYTGRDTPAARLIDAELNMRNRQIFYDIIYSDIDSVVALAIYE